MKRIVYSIVLALILVITAKAQNKGINYKAKIADNSGNALDMQSVTVQFTILEGNTGSNEVYRETHATTTDANGIIIINIGEGTAMSGNYNTINWGIDTHFLKTEIDTGSGYVEIGNTEFKAVPYALYAENSGNANSSSPFEEVTINVISANNTNADFLVGSTSTEDQNNINLDARMFFDKTKAAFRVGSVDGTQWNDTNRGLYSFAAGENNTASGINSVAFGENNLVLSSGAVAFGRNNNIINSGSLSAAIGFGNYVSGAQAVALGFDNEALGNYVFAGGNASDVYGEGCFAYGFQNVARGDYNTVFGYQSLSNISAEYSFTAGYRLENHSLYGTVIGQWNDIDTDALFNIGNGNSTTRQSAFKVMRNGDVQVENLSGNGTRAVGVDTNGTLTTIPVTINEDVYVVSFADFKPFSANNHTDIERDLFDGVYITTPGSTANLMAPIHLPKNATITKVDYIYKDSNTQVNRAIDCVIGYQNYDASTNSSPTVWVVPNTSINTDNYPQNYGKATVDNINWELNPFPTFFPDRYRTYFVRIGALSQSSGWSGTPDTAIFQVHIHYTY